MKVTGENAVLYEYVSGDWIPYACSRSISIEFTTDMLETSVSGSGAWATFLPTKNSWTASMEGVVYLEESGKLSIADLHTKQFNQTKIQLKFQRTDEGGNVYSNIGYAYITSSSDTGSFNDMDTFSVSFRGTGDIAQVFDPSVIVDKYRVHISSVLVCTSFPVTLYSTDTLQTGTIMYLDSGLTIPLTGKNYIRTWNDPEIFNIDNVTGTVETSFGSCP